MIRVAVIGVGNIGFHHARHYASFKQVKLVGVVDTNEQRGKEVADKVHTQYFPTYHELLAQEHVDGVSIAVPTHFHLPVVKDLAKHVKNILLEKPLSNTMSEAKKIGAIIKKYETNLAVGYLERFNPAMQGIKKLIDEQALGELLSITIKRVGMYPPSIKHADVITDLATHDIDILQYLLQVTPRILAAQAGSLVGGTYDHSEVFLQYGSIHCYLQTNWITPVKIRTMTLTGSKGYAEVNFITQEVKVYETNVQKTFSDFGDFVLRVGQPTYRDIDIRKEEPLKGELEAFIRSIREPADTVSYNDAMKALHLAEMIKRTIVKNNL